MSMRPGGASRSSTTREPYFWPAVAAAAGFVHSFVTATVLGWHRDLVKFSFALVALVLLATYVRKERVNPFVQLTRRWMGGLVVGAALGAVMVSGSSPLVSAFPTTGLAVALELLWSGMMYGTAIALVVNVLPVIAVYGSRPSHDLRDASQRLRWAASALGASLVVAASFFLGFEELRGVAIVRPLLLSGLATVAYLLAGNPLAAIIPAVVVHAAQVTSGVRILTPWISMP